MLMKVVSLLFIPIIVFSQAASGKEVVNVKDLIPDVVIDVRYNTVHNFTGEKLYSTDECFYSRAGIEALQAIQDSLHKVRHFDGKDYTQGLGIKIFDAYRPYTVQKLMQEIVGPEYVAGGVSNHNIAAAVDLTLIDMSNGQELDMGTEFDSFEEKAWHSYQNLPQNVLNNRHYLLSLMTEFSDFSYYSKEWWHYTHNPSKNNSVLDFQMK